VLNDAQKQEVADILLDLAEARVPIMVRDQVALQFRIERHDVLLFGKRPLFSNREQWIESSVAKFRWNSRAGTWSLLWHRNGKWHYYNECQPSARFIDLVREVDRDPTGIFWG